MKLTGPAVGQGDTMSQDATKAGSGLSAVVRPGLDTLIKHFQDAGHDDYADALLTIDFLMREYAYTFDPLTDNAKELGQRLRDVVGSWIKRGYGEPMA